MKKICLSLLFLTAVAISGMELKPEAFKWIVPHYHGGSSKTENGIIQLKMERKKSDKGHVWQVGTLKDKVSLDGYKYINFSARDGEGKTHLVYFYLGRRLAPGNEAAFYSIIELTPEWKDYCLRLQSGGKALAGRGGFKYTKGTNNCDIQLSKGGELLNIQPVSSTPTTLEFKDIRLTNSKESQADPALAEIVKKIKDHPRFKPYSFREIIKPDAVDISGFQIVISKDAGATEKFAAAELSGYLEKATGLEFPIVTVPGTKTIRLEVKPGKPVDGFSSQLLDGKNLTITGNSQRALVFAVYDFLEKAAGIRWFMPFDYGEVIPYNPKLKLPLFKDASAPFMTSRCSHYCLDPHAPGFKNHGSLMADWAFKNGFNVELARFLNLNGEQKKKEAFYKERGACVWLPKNWGHNFHKWIEPKKYFKDHPEFFCFDQATKQWRYKRAQICTTNPKLIAELGKIAGDYFKKYPQFDDFPLFQEDGDRLWCQCPACLALNPSGSNLKSTSNNNINLANLICAEIRKKYPDKGVVTAAYGVSTAPPDKIKPQPGVQVIYCYAPSDPNLMPWEARQARDILRWTELTNGNMIIYTYQYLNSLYPYNNEMVMLNIFRFLNVLRIKGCRQESAEFWGGISGYLIYLGARASWDPWFDYEAFKDDYFKKLYGPAAKPMRQSHDLLSTILCDKSKYLRQGFSYRPYFSEAVLKQMGTWLAEAEKMAAGDSRILKAVKAETVYLEYLKAHSKVLKTANDYYLKPSEKNYQAALNAGIEVEKLIRELAPSRLVSPYTARCYSAGLRGLKSSWRREQALSKLRDHFDIVKTLNPWKFRTDPKSQGDKEKWFSMDFDDAKWKSINSGSFWEQQGYKGYNGAAWYRMNLEIPESKSALGLYFGAADERAWVYLDGQYIGGHHEGEVGKLWNESFMVMLRDEVKPGRHQLTVKVIDSAGKGGLWKDVFLVKKK